MSVPEGLQHANNDVIIEEVKTLMMVREIGDKLGISKDSAHTILAQDSSRYCSGFVANYR